MNFFERELRKLFTDDKIMEPIYFENNACVGTLGKNLWICVRFISTFATVRYDALEIVVLDRLTRSAMTKFLKFEEIWRNKYVFADPDSGWQICPDIQVYPTAAKAYSFTEKNQEQLKNAVKQYLDPFCEQVPELIHGQPVLFGSYLITE